MKKRFLLLITAVIFLSSFTTPGFYTRYMNLDKVDSVAQNKLMTRNAQQIGKNKKFATHELGLYQKQIIEDSSVVAMIQGLVKKLYNNANLFQQSQAISIYLLGDIKLNEHITTRLVYIENEEYSNAISKYILGINVVGKQMISVIELAKSSKQAGWAGPATDSIRRGNKFKIIRNYPTDVSGPGIRKDNSDAFVIKVGDDGTVTRSFQYNTKYPPAF